VIPVPILADCADGFNAAYWSRPRATWTHGCGGPMSALAPIPETDRADGMRRLRADLDNGEWDRRCGHLLALDELDLGYRVLVVRS